MDTWVKTTISGWYTLAKVRTMCDGANDAVARKIDGAPRRQRNGELEYFVIESEEWWRIPLAIRTWPED